MKSRVSTEKALIMLLLSNLLMDLANTGLKGDEKVYRFTVKKHLNNLMKSLESELISSKKIMKLLGVSEEKKKEISDTVGYEYDGEMMEDGINTELDLLTDFISIYLNLDDLSLYKFSIILKNIKEDKNVFTLTEALDLSQKALKNIAYTDVTHEQILETILNPKFK